MVSRCSEVRGIKGLRKQIFHLNHFGFAFEIRHDHGNVAAEFPDQLAARPAGGRQRLGVRHHADGVEPALAFADGLENRDAFGANGKAVSGVFDVTAPKNPARSGAQRGPHAKIGKRRMRVFPRLLGRGNQSLVFAHEVFLVNDTVASAPFPPRCASQEEVQ